MYSLSEKIQKIAKKKIQDQIRLALQPGSLQNLIIQEVNTCLSEAFNAQLVAEQTHYLERHPYERKEGSPLRNGFKSVSVPGFFGRLKLRKPVLRSGSWTSSLIQTLRLAGQQVIGFLAVRLWQKGASTRSVATELQQAFGSRISATSISTLTNGLAPTLEQWQNRPIPSGIVYLYLDATYLPVKRPGFTHSEALLLALGLDAQGQRHFLGLQLGDRESLDTWSSFLKDLIRRGLKPQDLHLALSDEHKAIEAAVLQELGCPHQLCLVHKMRNVRYRVAARDQNAFLSDFKAIYWASSLEQALKSSGQFEERWKRAYPKAVSLSLEKFESLTRFFKEPPQTWKSLRTTNLLERFNREVKRRTRPAGAMQSELEVFKLLYSIVEGQEKSFQKRMLWKEVCIEKKIA
jgi:putative transposase